MQPKVQTTAYDLADTAPIENHIRCEKTGTYRKEMLSEAFDLISSMSDRQIMIFLELLGKELR